MQSQTLRRLLRHMGSGRDDDNLHATGFGRSDLSLLSSRDREHLHPEGLRPFRRAPEDALQGTCQIDQNRWIPARPMIMAMVAEETEGAYVMPVRYRCRRRQIVALDEYAILRVLILGDGNIADKTQGTGATRDLRPRLVGVEHLGPGGRAPVSGDRDYRVRRDLDWQLPRLVGGSD